MNIVNIDKSKCTGCTTCVNICPQSCIYMEISKEGFEYPQVNNDLCNRCGVCYSKCPITEINVRKYKKDCYATTAKDKVHLDNSSSGGVFSLLAENILNKKGFVYGAALSEDCYVNHHVRVDSLQGLKSIRKSKYLQSSLGSSFSYVKNDLENGNMVMFVGTPCQVNGLLNFLGKPYENLLTVDFICHGVASPKLWQKYLLWLERKKGKAINVDFRNKRYGWRNYSLSIDYCSGKKSNSLFRENTYINIMLDNYSLRNSCYSCSAKGNNRLSDITIGDFWGAERYFDKADLLMGISAIIINSENGKKHFSEIVEKTISYNVDYEVIQKNNVCLIASVEKPRKRKEFFKDLDNLNIKELRKKYVNLKIKKRIYIILLKLGFFR